jgi:hypothetical protein
MYFKPVQADATPITVTPAFTYLLVGMAMVVIFLGILPQWLLQFLYF